MSKPVKALCKGIIRDTNGRILRYKLETNRGKVYEELSSFLTYQILAGEVIVPNLQLDKHGILRIISYDPEEEKRKRKERERQSRKVYPIYDIGSGKLEGEPQHICNSIAIGLLSRTLKEMDYCTNHIKTVRFIPCWKKKDKKNLDLAIESRRLKGLKNTAHPTPGIYAIYENNDLNFYFDGDIWLPANAKELFYMPGRYTFKIDVIDLTGFEVKERGSVDGAFAGLEVQEIIGVENIGKNGPVNIHSAFSHCKMNSIDLTGWDVSHVKQAHGTFCYLEGGTLDITGWNNAIMSRTDYMFVGCKCTRIDGIEDLDFSHSTQHTIGMFKDINTSRLVLGKSPEESAGCRYLSNFFENASIDFLDISDFSIHAYAYLDNMFLNSRIGILNMENTELTLKMHDVANMFIGATISELHVNRATYELLNSGEDSALSKGTFKKICITD
jgi:hypothetical protein